MRYAFTNSETAEASCLARWFFRYPLRLRPAVDPRPLSIGSLWHRCMDLYYQPTDPQIALFQESSKAAERRVAVLRVFDFLESERARIGRFAPGSGPPATEEDLDLVANMFTQHAKIHAPDRWFVLSSEQNFSVTVPTTEGGPSWSVYEGRTDKIVREESGLWIVEHKTSSDALVNWIDNHRYRPQTVRYAWAIRKVTGETPVGVIYDLALTKPRPSLDDFKELKPKKDGTASGLSKVIPSRTDSELLRAAAVAYEERTGVQAWDGEWFAEKLAEICADEDRNGNLFVREERDRFAPGEIDRVGAELYAVGSNLRRLATKAEDLIGEYADTQDPEGGIVAMLQDDRAMAFYRNSSECVSWGRECAYMNACRFRNRDSFAGLRIAKTAHEELE